MIGFYDDLDFDSHASARPRRKNRLFLAALMFLAAYFTTITVQAQPQDGIALGQNESASVSGTVKEADENWVIVTSAGKDIKIVLDDVGLNGPTDTMFTPGMTVTADGKMTGDDFGMPIMEAKVISATSPAPVVAPAAQ